MGRCRRVWECAPGYATVVLETWRYGGAWRSANWEVKGCRLLTHPSLGCSQESVLQVREAISTRVLVTTLAVDWAVYALGLGLVWGLASGEDPARPIDRTGHHDADVAGASVFLAMVAMAVLEAAMPSRDRALSRQIAALTLSVYAMPALVCVASLCIEPDAHPGRDAM